MTRLLHRIASRQAVVLVVGVLLLAGVLQPDGSPVVASLPVAPPTIAHRVAAEPAAVPTAAAQRAPATATPVLRGAEPRSARVIAATRTERAVVAGASPREQRGRAALAALDYDWRRLGYDVVFRPGRGGTLGTANRRTRRITIYVRHGQSELSLRASIAHELGHALDFEHGTPERRAAYLRVRGLPAGTRWFPCNRCDDLSSPAGDFAEVFAAWLIGPGDFRSRVAGVPDERELAELGPLLRIPENRPSTSTQPQPQPEPMPSRSPSTAPKPEGPLPPVISPPPPPGVLSPRGV